MNNPRIRLSVIAIGAALFGIQMPASAETPTSIDSTRARSTASDATPPHAPRVAMNAADGADMPHDTAIGRATGNPADSGDAIALGLLGAVNDHEIATAKQAEGKSMSPAVTTYARKMEKEHTDNQSKTRSFGALSDNPSVVDMRTKLRADLDSLSEKSGKPYEQAYVDAMVADHAAVLELIDRRLMPMAMSDAVKTHLGETRAHVALHLDEAKKLQNARR
jgi:predicted outer membrane protein